MVIALFAFEADRALLFVVDFDPFVKPMHRTANHAITERFISVHRFKIFDRGWHSVYLGLKQW